MSNMIQSVTKFLGGGKATTADKDFDERPSTTVVHYAQKYERSDSEDFI